MEELILNNGIKMPNVGLGTFRLEPNDAYNSVLIALKNGYKMLDTANIYGNEKAVGRAIKDSGIKREDLFLSTKIWASEYNNPNAVQNTLDRLGVDYIDLLFVHRPTPKWREVYRLILDAYKKGIVRSIGVSNFEGRYMEALLKEFDILPQVNQVECHPFFPQEKLRETLDAKDIKLMSWAPLCGRGRTLELLNSNQVQTLAKKYNKTPGQIVTKWHTQMGFIVIPGSSSEKHIIENISIFDFTLSKEDMDLMATLNNGKRKDHQTAFSLMLEQRVKPKYEK